MCVPYRIELLIERKYTFSILEETRPRFPKTARGVYVRNDKVKGPSITSRSLVPPTFCPQVQWRKCFRCAMQEVQPTEPQHKRYHFATVFSNYFYVGTILVASVRIYALMISTGSYHLSGSMARRIRGSDHSYKNRYAFLIYLRRIYSH